MGCECVKVCLCVRGILGMYEGHIWSVRGGVWYGLVWCVECGVWSVWCVECGVECDVWCGVGLRILCQHNLPKSVAFKSWHNASIILKKGCGQVAYHTSTARVCQWHRVHQLVLRCLKALKAPISIWSRLSRYQLASRAPTPADISMGCTNIFDYSCFDSYSICVLWRIAEAFWCENEA